MVEGALEGSLKDFGVSDIFQLIKLQQKTGVITFHIKSYKSEDTTSKSAEQLISVFFENGDIVWADADFKSIEQRIIGSLSLRKLIKEQDVQELTKFSQENRISVINQIYQKGILPESEFKQLLTHHIKQIIYKIFLWKDGFFRFETLNVTPKSSYMEALNCDATIMEGLRILDEYSLIANKIPKSETVFRKNEDKSSEIESLSVRHQTVFSLIDGFKTFEEILLVNLEDEFETTKCLLDLYEENLIYFSEPSELAPTTTSDLFQESIFEKETFETIKPFEAKPGLSYFWRKNHLKVSIALLILFGLILSSNLIENKSLSFLTRELNKINQFKFLDNQAEMLRVGFAGFLYSIEKDTYPDDLLKLVNENYIPESEIIDVWGTQLKIQPQETNFTIISAGPDTKFGSIDDWEIKNQQLELIFAGF